MGHGVGGVCALGVVVLLGICGVVREAYFTLTRGGRGVNGQSPVNAQQCVL